MRRVGKKSKIQNCEFQDMSGGSQGSSYTNIAEEDRQIHMEDIDSPPTTFNFICQVRRQCIPHVLHHFMA